MIRIDGKMMIGTLNYPDLLELFQPRPIVTEAQYDATVAQINHLIDKGDLTADEQDLLTLLGTLTAVYEDKYYPDELFELRGIALIKSLMAESGLKQKDLTAIFKTESITSAILNGKRRLTVEHIGRLAAFFNLSHEMFFEPEETRFPSLKRAIAEPKADYHVREKDAGRRKKAE